VPFAPDHVGPGEHRVLMTQKLSRAVPSEQLPRLFDEDSVRIDEWGLVVGSATLYAQQ
jgi:hypothetical protein